MTVLTRDAREAVTRAYAGGIRRRATGLAIACGALGLTVLASLAFGARTIETGVVVDALLAADPTIYEHAVVWTERLPRTGLGVLVGLALGGAGVVMQALTRNPLADPGILGVQLGAAFGVVAGILWFGLTSLTGYFWFALVGAAITTVIVYLIAVRATATATHVSLILAGVAVAAFIGSVLTLILVRDEVVFAHYKYWIIGQLTGRGDVLGEAAVFISALLIATLVCGRTLNALHLGDETATMLGVKPTRARLLIASIAVALCAAATAACGPIGFVGLIGAHIARIFVGNDHRWLLPMGMVCGAVALIAADVVGRLIAEGTGEIEVGVMTAFVGAPFFVLIARRSRGASL